MVGPFRFIGYAVATAILYFAFGSAPILRVASEWANMGGIGGRLERILQTGKAE